MEDYTVEITGKAPLSGTARGTFSIVSNEKYQSPPSSTTFTDETFNNFSLALLTSKPNFSCINPSKNCIKKIKNALNIGR